jgi:uncharacterized protein (DUF2147 family)
MLMTRLLPASALALLGSLLLTQLSATASAADGPVGIWLTQKGDARVQVSRCGAGLCGKIVGLREPIDPATQKPAADDKNNNPALRGRPMIGMPLFTGMQPTGPNTWSGEIYNAQDGKTYEGHVTAVDQGQLQVRGCVGPICGGETWTRVR